MSRACPDCRAAFGVGGVGAIEKLLGIPPAITGWRCGAGHYHQAKQVRRRNGARLKKKKKNKKKKKKQKKNKKKIKKKKKKKTKKKKINNLGSCTGPDTVWTLDAFCSFSPTTCVFCFSCPRRRDRPARRVTARATDRNLAFGEPRSASLICASPLEGSLCFVPEVGLGWRRAPFPSLRLPCFSVLPPFLPGLSPLSPDPSGPAPFSSWSLALRLLPHSL